MNDTSGNNERTLLGVKLGPNDASPVGVDEGTLLARDGSEVGLKLDCVGPALGKFDGP